MQQESSSSSGIFKLLDPASSSASIAGAGVPTADAANGTGGAAPEQDRRKRNLNYRFHFLESDEDDMLSAGSSFADRSTGAAVSGVDDNTQSSAAGGKFGRYREDNYSLLYQVLGENEHKGIGILTILLQKSQQEEDVVGQHFHPRVREVSVAEHPELGGLHTRRGGSGRRCLWLSGRGGGAAEEGLHSRGGRGRGGRHDQHRPRVPPHSRTQEAGRIINAVL